MVGHVGLVGKAGASLGMMWVSLCYEDKGGVSGTITRATNIASTPKPPMHMLVRVASGLLSGCVLLSLVSRAATR